jgi:predicted ATPase
VLPGIEITTLEGVHLLAVFPKSQTTTERTELKGWLDFQGDGDTRQASRKSLDEILHKVDSVGGVIIVPHPFTDGIGMLDDARKMSTKVDWLETGHVRLIQVAEERVRYVGRDEDGNWVNRYVLASARAEQVRSSSYCLAPFNRTDAHEAAELSEGCSWFRMSEPTVQGLKQVACEPKTRISRVEPKPRTHDCILGISVKGGYFDSETFRFSDGLTCIIGQNYAGKSSVLDFIRFALEHDARMTNPEEKSRFLGRLNGILQPDGTVEAFIRAGGQLYVVRRSFHPLTDGVGPRFRVVESEGRAQAYRFDQATHQLDPCDGFDCPIEVYEQGRIGRLRDDLGRQLEMLDEFAGTQTLKAERRTIIEELNRSARALAPLYEERDKLSSQAGALPQLEAELAEKEKYLPGEEEKKWAASQHVVESLQAESEALRGAASAINALEAGGLADESTTLDVLFQERTPAAISATDVAHPEILEPWRSALVAALKELKACRERALAAIKVLAAESVRRGGEWKGIQAVHHQEISAKLAKAGVESPRELLKRVQELGSQVSSIKTKTRPRLVELRAAIDQAETIRAGLVDKLRTLSVSITSRRQERAVALTSELNEQIKVLLRPAGDDAAYRQVLQELTALQRVQVDQLARVTARLSPLELSDALRAGGQVLIGGVAKELRQVCDITDHAQTVLSRIAEDIEKLNRLETTIVQDVPEILVRRRGEENYANLRTELSPGEQSAALLMLALQTHSLPLILDQPEDELGYDYVVHLVVPALLEAKGSRQILVVTHNANIAVLGDTDYVSKLENHPSAENGRHCQAAVSGTFEEGAVTKALLDLEGGQRAFQFRLHRYALQMAAKPDKQRFMKDGTGPAVEVPPGDGAHVAPSSLATEKSQ